MEQKEIKYQGKRIIHDSIGEGIPIVLIHGFGENRKIWKPILPALKEYHVIIPDLPGTGESEIIDDMSMEGISDMLERLIVHETATVYYKEGEPGSVFMIGHSMGGYITLAFAERHHAMLRGFGLFESTAFADTEQKIETRKKSIQFIQEHSPYEFLKTSTPNLYSAASKENKPEKIKEQINSIRDISVESLISYYEAMIKRPDRTHILKETKLPVLLVLGRHDTAVPIEDGLKLADLSSLSYIHILENSGHMGMVEEPEETSKAILKYLDFALSGISE
jgi:pimeloyl-ACP methyl ester carboxylesterase